MNTKKLVVFFGKPGAGKTTLIGETFPDANVVDVKAFVRKYRVDGTVPEEKTLQGYQDMYEHIAGLDDDLIILELGANHEKFNVQELLKSQDKRELYLFLCNASLETLKERLQNRSDQDDMEKMLKRLERDFPGEYIRLFEKAGMQYILLDMEQPWTDNLILVQQRLRDDK